MPDEIDLLGRVQLKQGNFEEADLKAIKKILF